MKTAVLLVSLLCLSGAQPQGGRGRIGELTPLMMVQASGNADTSDLYDKLWAGSLDIAKQALESDFLQSMQGAHLSAERYIVFSLQDICYCAGVTEMLGEMVETIQEPDLKKWFEKRHVDYQIYTNEILKKYNLTDTSQIIVGPAISNYLSYYRSTMKLDPVYFAVALMPCETLWPWLAENLHIKDHMAYTFWQRGNLHGHAEKTFGPLLTKYAARIDEGTAMNIYRHQIEHERNFFEAA